MNIKDRINNELKDAMRARDARKVLTLRMITAAIKQVEVDERIEVDETRMLVILDKMAKQRKESISQFEKAGRDDLVAQETYELEQIEQYLPEQLSDEDIQQLVNEAIESIGAEKMADMGKVMAALKPKLQGRADMSEVSTLIKEKLS